MCASGLSLKIYWDLVYFLQSLIHLTGLGLVLVYFVGRFQIVWKYFVKLEKVGYVERLVLDQFSSLEKLISLFAQF
ncbi:hypothetical protein BpHYR1_010150 [Brachionus plicatilis]|uniref:Uncharacterized protein n=1 Tax=Brachionus plicatilis TaxID=10195 RepID=A0A3M7PUF4_BRAPC|nr:hypothetical protein BpHYR1_010150 [Brachionus plicatilis]